MNGVDETTLNIFGQVGSLVDSQDEDARITP